VRVLGATGELTGNVGALPSNTLTPLPGLRSVWLQPKPTNPDVVELVKRDVTYRTDFARAFPDVDPLQLPFGPQVMVQLRTPRRKSAGGIEFSAETRDAERWNTQIGLVLAVGPVAFKRRDSLEPWPEGAWCRPGDFIRVPLHGGDKWEIPVPRRGADENAMFAFFRDLDLLGRVTGDPLAIKGYV
jgi:hypothetical protein